MTSAIPGAEPGRRWPDGGIGAFASSPPPSHADPRTPALRRPAGSGAPLALTLLDQFGFRLKSLAAAGDWDGPEIGRAVDGAGRSWRYLAKAVADRGISEAMAEVLAELGAAAASGNADQLRFAAEMELEAVDLMSRHLAAVAALAAREAG